MRAKRVPRTCGASCARAAPYDLHAEISRLLFVFWRRSYDRGKTMAAAGYLDAGFTPKAIAVWTVAAQTFPEQVEYWERIANEQVKRGKRQDAVLALLQGRSMLRNKRQRPLALLLLRQVLELEPGHVDATIDLADQLRRDGTHDEAKRLLAGLLVRTGTL